MRSLRAGTGPGVAALLWLACLAVTACTPTVEVPRGLGDPSETIEEEGACGLLAVEEVEVVVNRSLEGTQVASQRVATATAEGGDAAARAGAADAPPRLLPGMDMCGLGSASAGATWGVLTGPAEEQYRRYVEWHEDYLEKRSVEGHDAVWDPALRTLIVLVREDLAFGISLTPDDPVLANGEDREAYAENRAVELTIRALGRL